MSFEEFVANLTENDLKRLNQAFYKKQNKLPVFQYGKIKDADLEHLFVIKERLEREPFEVWFHHPFTVDDETVAFLKALIHRTEKVIRRYNEEDLKIKFIAKIIDRVNFESYRYEFRDFYELPLCYQTKRFIFRGTVDFAVAKGLLKAEKPYFFIQEFKKAEEYSNPRPQLLAELISGLELNQWTSIKGVYIIGTIWYFVLLEKLAEDNYQYFVSQHFDCTKLDDLKAIYRHLSFVKKEILDFVKGDKNG